MVAIVQENNEQIKPVAKEQPLEQGARQEQAIGQEGFVERLAQQRQARAQEEGLVR